MNSESNIWRLGPFRRQTKSEEIIFGQVREDYTFEAGLARGKVLCIASGGDLAFEALCHGAERVSAVDVNIAQVFLVELKMEALRLSRYSDALGCFTGDARRSYPEIWPHLSASCAEFFDSRQHLLKNGLQNVGVADRVIGHLAKAFKRLMRSEAEVHRFLIFDNVEEQQDYFRLHWNDWRWNFSFRAAFNPISLKWVLGGMFSSAIPKSFATDFRTGFADVFESVPNQRNPFVWQALEGRYPPRCLPDWLKEENWSYMKSRLGDLHVQKADVLEHILQAEAGSFDSIFLSNILDVVTPGYLEDLVGALSDRCLTGSQVVSRSFFASDHLTKELVSSGFKLGFSDSFVDRSFFCRHRQHLLKK